MEPSHALNQVLELAREAPRVERLKLRSLGARDRPSISKPAVSRVRYDRELCRVFTCVGPVLQVKKGVTSRILFWLNVRLYFQFSAIAFWNRGPGCVSSAINCQGCCRCKKALFRGIWFLAECFAYSFDSVILLYGTVALAVFYSAVS